MESKIFKVELFLNLSWARGTSGLRHVISNVQSVCDESF